MQPLYGRSLRRLAWMVIGLTFALAVGAAVQAASGRDEVIVALDSDLATLDPAMHNERVIIITTNSIFDNLVFRNPQGQLVPWLAESYRTLSDTVWEFRLRRGVRFHDGQELTAEDVKFTIDRILDPNMRSPQFGNLNFIRQAEVVDRYTVRLHTTSPYPILLERLAYMPIVPRTYVTRVGNSQFAQQPIGTGPFRFARWIKGDRIELEANPDYWQGPPAFRRLVFRVVPNPATQLAELATGGVHIIRQVPPDLADQIERQGNRVATIPILRMWYLSMNNVPPFDDINFRRAIQHAIDIEGIMEGIFQGRASRVPAWVGPLQFGFAEGLQAPAYDPQRAREYLRRSSYRGQAIELASYVKGAGPNVAQLIVQYLRQIGINVTYRPYAETGTYTAEDRACRIPFGMATWGSFSVFDADAVLFPMFHKDGAYGRCRQFEPEFQNRVLDEARSTLDANRRRQLYRQFQQWLIDQAAGISMFAPYDIYGIAAGLQYTPRPDEVIYPYHARWE